MWVIPWQPRDRNAPRIAETLSLKESVSEPTVVFGCGGSVLRYRVRGLCRVQGKLGQSNLFWIQEGAWLGPSRLFRVQGDAWPEPFVLGSGRGPSS